MFVGNDDGVWDEEAARKGARRDEEVDVPRRQLALAIAVVEAARAVGYGPANLRQLLDLNDAIAAFDAAKGEK